MDDLKDTLDSSSITDSVVDVQYHNGYTFSFGLRIAISFLGLFGLFAVFSGGPGYLLGPPILLFTFYAHTSTFGTDVSFSNNYIREYSKSFWIKRGKWKPTVLLPDITILKMGKSIGVNHVYSEKTTQITKTVYSVSVLSANHRKRVLIRETESAADCYEVAVFLSEKMSKNLVDFNPVISQATRDKRYERH
ncbi:MAG: hypothetical protein ACI8ZM_002462 [Crocinitomix sp.]|jgi:hypothetical protein